MDHTGSIIQRLSPGRHQLSWPVMLLGLLQLLSAGLLIALLTGPGRWLGLLLLGTGLVLTFAAARTGRDGGVALAEVLRGMDAERADLAREMPGTGDARSRETARLFNGFLKRLRSAMVDLQHQVLEVSLASSRSRQITRAASGNAGRQGELSELIFQSSDETAKAVEELSRRTSTIAETNSRNLDVARSSQSELAQAVEHVEAVTGLMQDFNGTVSRLEGSAQNIASILETVQGFAAQTNMLALNAAIEAARAGEQGRGFAVVADEVRGLAEKVQRSAEQIGDLLDDMGEAVSSTASGTQDMLQRTDQARGVVESTAARFDGMVADFATTNDDLLLVSSAIEQLSVTNREVHARSTEIRDLGLQICRDMERSEEEADRLGGSSDRSLHMLSQFRLGQGRLDELLEIAERRRDQVAEAVERLMDQGVDMFSRNHQPIPGTNPQQYDVGYARPFQQACQDLVEAWRGEIPHSPFCLPLDDKGYVAIHYREVSQPPTGDPEVDLLKSRNKRFYVKAEDMDFDSRFRIQSYLRDTGEAMFNLIVPVHVRGRRWGGVFLGLTPEALNIR